MASKRKSKSVSLKEIEQAVNQTAADPVVEADASELKEQLEVDTSAHEIVKKKLEKRRQKNRANPRRRRDKRGVVYLGHIPFGFFEEQMKSYFSQFGDVTRLRLSRSPKTGKSRGFAFIEFKDAEVAAIVAETMHNYLMFDRLLQCHVVPKDKIHPKLFVNPRRRNRAKHAIERQNGPLSEDQIKARQQRAAKRDARMAQKLEKLGIDYDLPARTEVAESTEPSAKRSKTSKTTTDGDEAALAKEAKVAKSTTKSKAKSTTATPKSEADKGKSTTATPKPKADKGKSTTATPKSKAAKGKSTTATPKPKKTKSTTATPKSARKRVTKK